MAENEELFLPPMSNNERILMNILGMEGVDIEPPQSRIEKLLLAILEQGSMGGGGSTTLAGLNDVDIDDETGGQILAYDAVSEKWVNTDNSIVLSGTASGSTISVEGASPAAILRAKQSGKAVYLFLDYKLLPLVYYSYTSLIGTATFTFCSTDSTDVYTVTFDTVSMSATTYSGTLSNVTILKRPASAVSGQYLKFDGTDWIAADLPVYSGGVS